MDKKWTPIEDQKLFQHIILNGGKNWKKISQGVGDKTENECRKRWSILSTIVKEEKNDNTWNRKDDQTLSKAIAQVSNDHFSVICKCFKEKNQELVRQKMNHYLFTVTELMKVFACVRDYDSLKVPQIKKEIKTADGKKSTMKYRSASVPLLDKSENKDSNSPFKILKDRSIKLNMQQFFDLIMQQKNIPLWSTEEYYTILEAYEKEKGNWKKICAIFVRYPYKDVKNHFYTLLKWAAYEYRYILDHQMKKFGQPDGKVELEADVKPFYIINPGTSSNPKMLKFIPIAKSLITVLALAEGKDPLTVSLPDNPLQHHISQIKNTVPFFCISSKEKIKKEESKCLETKQEQPENSNSNDLSNVHLDGIESHNLTDHSKDVIKMKKRCRKAAKAITSIVNKAEKALATKNSPKKPKSSITPSNPKPSTKEDQEMTDETQTLPPKPPSQTPQLQNRQKSALPPSTPPKKPLSKHISPEDLPIL
ncbi:unnamed protein product [Moneuplotes crassus]|uniref:Myb-like DNA-binding domain containing protein n=1 Tax=Euplotes crassus TaxID=5936 RepID=A0AAD1ULB5_EUPCR|nr:unnamed protein product [Moneuplotes crassus]